MTEIPAKFSTIYQTFQYLTNQILSIAFVWYIILWKFERLKDLKVNYGCMRNYLVERCNNKNNYGFDSYHSRLYKII